MTQAVVASIRKRGGGAIVNTSSIGAWQATGVYSLTKLAVNGLTVGLAKELRPYGIRVNAIAPGDLLETNGRGLVEAVQDTPRRSPPCADATSVRR